MHLSIEEQSGGLEVMMPANNPGLFVLQPALAWTTFRVGLYCGFFIILAISFVLTGESRGEPRS